MRLTSPLPAPYTVSNAITSLVHTRTIYVTPPGTTEK